MKVYSIRHEKARALTKCRLMEGRKARVRKSAKHYGHYNRTTVLPEL